MFCKEDLDGGVQWGHTVYNTVHFCFPLPTTTTAQLAHFRQLLCCELYQKVAHLARYQERSLPNNALGTEALILRV